MPNHLCPVQGALELLGAFAAERLCGRCLPCLVGTAQAGALLRRLRDGAAGSGDVRLLAELCDRVRATARCKYGRDTFGALATLLAEGEGGFLAHLEGRCPAGTCTALLHYRILPDRCTLCDRCRGLCPEGAIVGPPKTNFRNTPE